MAYGNQLQPITLREVAFGSITGSYANLGTALDESLQLWWVANDTDTNIYISLDGSNDHIKLGASTRFIVDVSANSSKNNQNLELAKSTQVELKHDGTAATEGAVTMGGFYA